MKVLTLTIFLSYYTLLRTGYCHVTMHQYHEQTGYPVSYSRVIGPSSSTLTMNRDRMTLHPVPTHTTLWPPAPPSTNHNNKQNIAHTWSRQHHTTTTPSPWRIILPPSHSYNDHYLTPNHVTVIHHHVFHRYHHRPQHSPLITQALITTTPRPRIMTTSRPPVQITEATTEATTTERLAERRSTTSKEIDCSGERKRQEIWRDDRSSEENKSLGFERNFPSYSDY